jgi:ribosomal protein S18 acetylase RimI-like enzyme
MNNSNFERMMQIIDETFSTREDPDQLQVDEKVIERLNELHPASLSEYNEENGPAVWVLVIPTVAELMEKFLDDQISEQQLFNDTKPGMNFDCIYLCSATVLPEYRRKGLAKKMTIEAIENIREDFKIRTLFVWPFSEGGIQLARKIAGEVDLELKIKN